MYQIKRADFNRLKEQHPDYIVKCLITHTWEGKTAKAGKDYMAFESVLTGEPSKGTKLCFEHIHFEIV